MNGKVVIVTGATNGIGEVTALELARQGAEVVIISRNPAKLERTVNKIQSETGNQQVSAIQADLASIADIRQAAEQFLQTHDRLDVLVNNAGAFFADRQESVDGNEMTLALNHLNYFLLTNLLLDTLKQTASTHGEARVVSVSSGAHNTGKINFDDFQAEQYSGFGRYSDSKLMNVLFTYELARQLEGTGVTANVLHPGFVDTGFGLNNEVWWKGILNGLQNLFAISPEKGAETMIYLASSPEVTGITGKYWEKKQQKSSSKISYNTEIQKRLWQVSADLVGLETAQPV
ncbi:MAG: SDR family oxidoreductase [Anaerolineae bacterium]